MLTPRKSRILRRLSPASISTFSAALRLVGLASLFTAEWLHQLAPAESVTLIGTKCSRTGFFAIVNVKTPATWQCSLNIANLTFTKVKYGQWSLYQYLQ